MIPLDIPLPSGWEVASLDQIAVKKGLVSGPFGSAISKKYFVDGGVPVIRGSNLSTDSWFHDDGFVYITDERADELSNAEVLPGDLVFTAAGTLGQVGLLPSTVRFPRYIASNKQLRARTKPEVADARYVFYWFRVPAVADFVASMNRGSSVPLLTLGVLRDLPVPLPPIDEQRRIADFIEGIDRMIENNRRRIEILEEMARLIYREWFVHFRFPDHEDIELVDSDLGPIPEGWCHVPLGELAEVVKGLSYKGAHLADEGTPMANLKCLAPDGGFRRKGVKPYDGPYKDRHAVEAGDIVVANTDLTQAGNVIGSAARLPAAAFGPGGLLTHHLFRVRLHDGAPVGPGYLLSTLHDTRFREWARGCASGTTVLGLRREDAEKYSTLVPSKQIGSQFEAAVQPLRRLAENLEDQCEVLAESRDLLLPRLISGELDVSDLDLDLEPVA